MPVTTEIPWQRARKTKVRAGSMPPMSSTTMSMESIASAGSVVNSSRAIGASRGASTLRTSTRRTSISAPERAAKSSRLDCRMRMTWLPTVPAPRTPTVRTGRGADMGFTPWSDGHWDKCMCLFSDPSEMKDLGPIISPAPTRDSYRETQNIAKRAIGVVCSPPAVGQWA